MLLKSHTRVTYFLCFLVTLVDCLVGSLYLVSKQLDLFEDAEVHLFHKELSMLVVTQGLMGVNAEGVCQLGNVMRTFTINTS